MFVRWVATNQWIFASDQKVYGDIVELEWGNHGIIYNQQHQHPDFLSVSEHAVYFQTSEVSLVDIVIWFWI